MGMQLHVCLVDGLPKLEVVDAETGEVLLSWAYQMDAPVTDKKQLQDLFRKFVLLTLRQGNSNPRYFSFQKVAMLGASNL